MWVSAELVQQHPARRSPAEHNVEYQQVGLLPLEDFKSIFHRCPRQAPVTFFLEQILN
jgi:hypothetical protein